MFLSIQHQEHFLKQPPPDGIPYCRLAIEYIIERSEIISKQLFDPYLLSPYNKVELAENINRIKYGSLDQINKFIIETESSAQHHEQKFMKMKIDEIVQNFRQHISEQAVHAGVSPFTYQLPLPDGFQTQPGAMLNHAITSNINDFMWCVELILKLIHTASSTCFLTHKEMSEKNEELFKIGAEIQQEIGEFKKIVNPFEGSSDDINKIIAEMLDKLENLEWKKLAELLLKLIRVSFYLMLNYQVFCNPEILWKSKRARQLR